MSDLSVINNLPNELIPKNKDSNVPQILFDVKNKINSPNFVNNINKVLPLIKDLKNEVLLIQNGGNKNKKYRKTYTCKKYKKGGAPNDVQKIIPIIIMTFIIVTSLAVPTSSVSEIFNCLISYPKSVLENMIIPFLNVVANNNLQNTVGYSIASKIITPTFSGAYKKIIASMTGDVLAINGLWGLYLNVNKFKNYITSISKTNTVNNTEISVQKKQVNNISNDINGAVNNVVKEILYPEQTGNINTNNFKIIDIPSNSKLIIDSNQELCK